MFLAEQPRDETETVTPKLHVSSPYTQEPDFRALVLYRGVYKHKKRVKDVKGQYKAEDDKYQREEVYEPQRARMTPCKGYPRLAGVADLAVELAEVSAALVVEPGVRNKRGRESGLDHSHTEVHVFAESHRGETAQMSEDFAFYAHIEGAREEAGDLTLAAAYAARGEERGHRVADCLLHRGEIVAAAVGSAEGVGVVLLEVVFYSFEVSCGNDSIGVQNEKIIAFCPLGGIVARHRRASVFLI